MNILRAENIRQVRAGPSTEWDDKASIGRDDQVGTGGDNKASKRRNNKVSTGENHKVSIRERDNKASTGRQNNKASTRKQENHKVGDPRRDDKGTIGWQVNEKATKPAARAYRIGTQRLSLYAFLFAARSNHFFAFLFLESMIDWPLSSGSTVNSGLSMTLANCDTSSLR